MIIWWVFIREFSTVSSQEAKNTESVAFLVIATVNYSNVTSATTIYEIERINSIFFSNFTLISLVVRSSCLSDPTLRISCY